MGSDLELCSTRWHLPRGVGLLAIVLLSRTACRRLGAAFVSTVTQVGYLRTLRVQYLGVK